MLDIILIIIYQERQGRPCQLFDKSTSENKNNYQFFLIM